MKERTIPELITERTEEFGVSEDLALAIAFCESTYRQYDKNKSAEESAENRVLRGIQNKADVGLFQINEKYHLEKSLELGYDIYTTEGNIDYALWLLKNEGSKHWKWSQECWSKKINSQNA